MKARKFIKALDGKKISEAIANVERRTSGEIRVVIVAHKVKDPLESAKTEFFKLGMEKTRDRNAVLIYFAPESRQFAVWGDVAVHNKCGEEFWRGIVQEMSPLLKQEKFTDAIILAVNRIGDVLEKHFPEKPDDINELSNDVVFREPPDSEK